jgi:UDP-glucose-4-epimerase GalE
MTTEKCDRATILVVGGAGYIGSHCCKALRLAGFQPVVFDNFSTGHRDFVKWGPLVEGDILDGSLVQSALRAHKPVAVIHFAALALVGESVADPSKYWRVNVGGVLSLLDAMRSASVDKLVFSSTCAVYGEPSEVPIHEDVPKNPVNPYGATKLAAERMMDDFGAAYGLRSVRLRYFNACGADPALEIGEDRDIETHLIPLILDAARERRPSIGIFGTDYPTPDGTAIRDYIHVVDLADAHVRAVKYLVAGGDTVAVNLGAGKGASVAEVIGMAERVVGRPVPQVKKDRRPGDPANLVADTRKAARILEWRCGRSDLNTIMNDAWAWHGKRFGVHRPVALSSLPS